MLPKGMGTPRSAASVGAKSTCAGEALRLDVARGVEVTRVHCNQPLALNLDTAGSKWLPDWLCCRVTIASRIRFEREGGSCMTRATSNLRSMTEQA